MWSSFICLRSADTSHDRSISYIATWDGKLEPPIDAIRVVRETDMAVQLWQRYVSTALLPLSGTSLANKREMAAFNSSMLSRIENKVNELIQRATDGEHSCAE
jgi:hypothetical protein